MCQTLSWTIPHTLKIASSLITWWTYVKNFSSHICSNHRGSHSFFQLSSHFSIGHWSQNLGIISTRRHLRRCSSWSSNSIHCEKILEYHWKEKVEFLQESSQLCHFPKTSWSTIQTAVNPIQNASPWQLPCGIIPGRTRTPSIIPTGTPFSSHGFSLLHKTTPGKKKVSSQRFPELVQLRCHVKTTHERCGPFSLVALSQRSPHGKCAERRS